MSLNSKSVEEFKEKLKQQQWMRDRFYTLFPQICKKDELIPASEITIQSDGNLFLKSDLRVRIYADWRIRDVLEYLLTRPSLWEQTAIRVGPSDHIVGRAPIFGVPFQRAIEIALREGLTKSVFWLPLSGQDENVLYSQLLVRVTKRKESNGQFIIVESWEWIGEGVEVLYTHMILTHDVSSAIHLDGAIVTFESDCEIASIFQTGNKRKGCRYEKYFRLDGEIKIENALQIIRAFFSVEELVDEYFEYSNGWPPILEGSA